MSACDNSMRQHRAPTNECIPTTSIKPGTQPQLMPRPVEVIHDNFVPPQHLNSTNTAPLTSEDDHPMSLSQNIRPAATSVDLLWACPFYKSNPLTYYRCLEKYKLRRCSDVRQHVRRHHKIILSRKDSQNNEKSWYLLWDYLFEEHPRPPSPYVQVGIAEPIALLRSCAEFSLRDNLLSWLQDANYSQVNAEDAECLSQKILSGIFEASLASQKYVGSEVVTRESGATALLAPGIHVQPFISIQTSTHTVADITSPQVPNQEQPQPTSITCPNDFDDFITQDTAEGICTMLSADTFIDPAHLISDSILCAYPILESGTGSKNGGEIEFPTS